MPKMNAQKISTHFPIQKISHVLTFSPTPVTYASTDVAAHNVSDFPTLNHLLQFADHWRERTLYPNHSLCIVFCSQSSHFFGNSEVLLEWPFDEDGFAGYDAGPNGLEMPVYAGATDHEVYVCIFGKIWSTVSSSITIIWRVKDGNSPSGSP